MKSTDWYRLMSEYGVQVEQPLPEEFEGGQLEALVDSEDSTVQLALGTVYQTGPGDIERDPMKSAIWFRRSADQGNPMAQALLARSYLKGNGVPLSYAEAYKWSKESSENGDRLGEFLFAMCLKEGYGVPSDSVLAYQKLQKLANLGDPDSMVLLAVMLATGEGVCQDRIEAYAWANVAAAIGSRDAAEARDSIKAMLKREALVEAQKRSLEKFEHSRVARGEYE